jgi:cobalt-zinc-cadmium efflux system protein
MEHDHDANGHAHEHSHGISGGKMGFAVILTLAFVVGEIIAGYFSHSLALLSDAGHNFADAAALGFSWYALWIARRPSNAGMTFGYHRVGIMAALVNAVSLVMIALFIVYEAVERLHHPQPVNSWIMIGVALVAVVINFVIGFWLHAGSKENINIRGAYLHMIGDAVSAFGVVVAGVIVLFTKASIADPIVSFIIAALILKSSWGILRESVTILLEGTPEGLKMAEVVAAIRNVGGVKDVHDLHVWTVGPGVIACCCHILVDEQSVREGQQVLRLVRKELDHRFKINHTTVQVEVEGHECDDMYCSIQPAEGAHVGHHH